MISEKENILKGTVVYSPEFEADARKVVVKTSNIVPNESGIVPLGKENSFEVEEEVMDFAGPSTAGPLKEPEHSDIIEEAPVLTEDPSKLQEVIKPIQEEIEKRQEGDLIKDEIENGIVSPLGVKMPEIETPLDNAPSGVNDALFADSTKEEKKEEKAEEAEEDLPLAIDPDEPESKPEEKKEEEVLAEEPAPTPEPEPIPEEQVEEPAFGTNTAELEVIIDDKLIQFENKVKAHLENQIDALSADLKSLISMGKKTDKIEEGNGLGAPISAQEERIEIVPPADVLNTGLPQPIPTPEPAPAQVTSDPTLNAVSEPAAPEEGIPGLGPTPFNIEAQAQDFMNQPDSMVAEPADPTLPQTPVEPAPQEAAPIDDGPIKGGGMFINF